jgi:hypothetical protein
MSQATGKRGCSSPVANGLVRQLDHELKQIYALRYGIERAPRGSC